MDSSVENFKVYGMSCAACSARVEKAVSKLKGVKSVSVNLLTSSMKVVFTPPLTSEIICLAVQKAGYRAENTQFKEKSAAPLKQDNVTSSPLKRLIASVAITLVLMYVAMGEMLKLPLPAFLSGEKNALAVALFQLLLSATVILINNRFFVSGFKAALHLAPNMDTLVTLGSSASFLYSLFLIFKMSYAVSAGDFALAISYKNGLYFDGAAMILTLISLGKLLEGLSKGKTTDAVKKLMSLAPSTARIVVDGVEAIVPVEAVKVGDIFAVYPGESIAVDGEVVEGFSAVDESALTGESIPVDKSVGDNLSAGTINTNGHLRVKATKIGQDTTLSNIVKMINEVSATKAPIAKIADKVSGIFVPTVILIAIITAAVWLILGFNFDTALTHAVSVLVISCPCALGLATPVAIMVGSGKSAKFGILFKTATALEATGKIKTVLLDKTGTITLGIPAITDIIPLNNNLQGKLLYVAKSLEKKSEHPLAKAIMAEESFTDSLGETEGFEVLSGFGVKARLDGKSVLGGNEKLLSSEGIDTKPFQNIINELSQAGKTPLLFAEEGSLLGIIAVADKIKESSLQAIAELKRLNIKVVMATGDNLATALTVAKSVQIAPENVYAGILPGDKKELIDKLKKEGLVMMVGDGINDAPALTAADVGVAIGAGTDIALDASDVVLIKNDLTDAAKAVVISRKVIKNIKENLFWAFIYNFLGIPLAAGVLTFAGITLNPMIAAAAMSLSSVCVVTNALRLNLLNPNKNLKTADNRPIDGCSANNCKALNTFNSTNKQTNLEVNTMKTILISGMMCAHCEARVNSALQGIPGIKSARADAKNNQCVIELDGQIDESVIAKTIEEIGYTFMGIK